MKRRNTWITTAVAAALAVCCTTGFQPKTVSDAATKSKTAQEVVNWDSPKHFTSPSGGVFEFYEIYLLEDEQELTSSMSCRELACGIVWQPTDYSEVSGYIQEYDKMFDWDTEGTFSFNGEDYNYNLVPPAKLRREHRVLLEHTIVQRLPLTADKISYFDYSKDGRIMVNDLVLLNQRLAHTPFNYVSNLDVVSYDQMDPEEFFNILDYQLSEGMIRGTIMYGDKIPNE